MIFCTGCAPRLFVVVVVVDDVEFVLTLIVVDGFLVFVFVCRRLLVVASDDVLYAR
jgi:hypothetical protein